MFQKGAVNSPQILAFSFQSDNKNRAHVYMSYSLTAHKLTAQFVISNVSSLFWSELCHMGHTSLEYSPHVVMYTGNQWWH